MSSLSLPVVEEQAFHRHFETDLRSAPTITTLQINIGLRCNLACNHCHVDSSPARIAESENMTADVANRVMQWLSENPSIQTVDITGGSPEMNPNFTRIVKHARGLGMDVIDRCNPTILTYTETKKFGGADYRWVPAFLAENQVIVTASLPCYTADNVDAQRGRGSYDASVEGLLLLNDVGYGKDPELPLNLVYNPGGASLPPPQESLEDDYKRELRERFGIEFTQLWTITNMPIKRWRRDLEILHPYQAQSRAIPAAIDRARGDWVRYSNAQDPTTLIERVYASDAVYFNDGRVDRGRSAITQRYQYMTRPGWTIQLYPRHLAWLGADAIVEVGQYQSSGIGHYVLFWQQQADGTWHARLGHNF